MPSEAEIEADCIAIALEELGLFPKVRFVGRRGCNDRLLILPYLPVVFVELKTARGPQSRAQQQWENALVSRGQPYWLVRSVKEFRERIARYKETCGGIVMPEADAG